MYAGFCPCLHYCLQRTASAWVGLYASAASLRPPIQICAVEAYFLAFFGAGSGALRFPLALVSAAGEGAHRGLRERSNSAQKGQSVPWVKP